MQASCSGTTLAESKFGGGEEERRGEEERGRGWETARRRDDEKTRWEKRSGKVESEGKQRG